MSQQFARLNEAHEALAEIFVVQQECLLVGAFDGARELLRAYRALLLVHMKHEEERVLPIYALAESKRWPEELFTGQHQKILQLLDRIDVQAAVLDTSAGWRRRVITLIELQSTLKHLLEHHHLAEDQALYPTADAQAVDGSATETVNMCLAEWAEAMAQWTDVVDSGRSAFALAAR